MAIQQGLTRVLDDESVLVTNLHLFEINMADELKSVLIEIEKKNLDIQIAMNWQEFTKNVLTNEKEKILITNSNIRSQADLEASNLNDVR